MPTFIILAAMKGRFISHRGNTYDNFQMMGYVESADVKDAVADFFDQPPYPIRWEDVEYLWAESLSDRVPTATTAITTGCTLNRCAAGGTDLTQGRKLRAEYRRSGGCAGISTTAARTGLTGGVTF